MPTWQELVIVCHTEEERQVVTHVTALRINQNVPAQQHSMSTHGPAAHDKR